MKEFNHGTPSLRLYRGGVNALELLPKVLVSDPVAMAFEYLARGDLREGTRDSDRRSECESLAENTVQPLSGLWNFTFSTCAWIWLFIASDCCCLKSTLFLKSYF